jgi:hypothetical protein
LVAHLTGGQGVAGSNPVSPTKEKCLIRSHFCEVARSALMLVCTQNRTH